MPGSADLKRLHTARERHAVLRLDEQVEVIVLDAQVDDAKVCALDHRDRRPPNCTEDGARTHPLELVGDAKRDVNGLG